jgi:hypothetical protein
MDGGREGDSSASIVGIAMTMADERSIGNTNYDGEGSTSRR